MSQLDASRATRYWIAGASSTARLDGDGWYTFTTPLGSAGVCVGIGASDLATDPAEPTHGFEINNGQYAVMESGVRVGPPVIPPTILPTIPLKPFAQGAVFGIVRYGGRVHYCIGAVGVEYKSAVTPFGLPGVIVYSSTVPSHGSVLLDASLLLPGDRVDDATLFSMGVGANVSLKPPTVFASKGVVGSVAVSFLPPTVDAHNGRGVDISFRPAQVRATQGESASVVISFMLPAVDARYGSSGVAVNGAYLQFRYMESGSSGPGTSDDSVDVALRPLAVSAVQGERSEVSLRFGAPVAFAFAIVDQTPAGAGPMITAVVPAFTGDIPAVPEEIGVVVDGAVMSDAAYYHSYAVLEDVMVVTGQPLTAGASPYMVEDTAAMSFSLSMAGTKDLVDGMVIDSAPLAESAYMLIQDALAMSTESVAASVSWPTISDAPVIADDAFPISLLDVSESMAASDAILAGSTADFWDDLVAGDELMLGSDATLEDAVTEGLVAWSEMDARSVSFPLLEGRMLASEQLLMKRPGLVAWVMNTDTGAVSWYDNWAFTSMATVGGKVFAAGPDGLHILGGDLDGVEQIDARVDYGYTEFGGYERTGAPKPSEQKKRVPALWFGYHAGGELQATVETYGQGLGPYTYAMAPRAADQPRNSRIVPGRGLSARYWRISVANKAGCDFEVHSVAAEVATTTRRL